MESLRSFDLITVGQGYKLPNTLVTALRSVTKLKSLKMQNDYFDRVLGAFAKLRKATVGFPCLHVRPRGAFRLPMDEFL